MSDVISIHNRGISGPQDGDHALIATPPTHYVLPGSWGSTTGPPVKEADFFIAQGGLTEEWGRHWYPVTASDIEDARRLGRSLYEVRDLYRESYSKKPDLGPPPHAQIIEATGLGGRELAQDKKFLQDAGLVPANTPAEAIENLGQRVIRMQAEMQGLAREHSRQFEAALYEASRLAAEIAKGGDAYHVGVRELAERLAPDIEAQAKTIEALMSRGVK